MRILYIDIDTLRADHLGCYGYHRNTSPNIDALAEHATIFDRCYITDAPCLPSRTALWSGRCGFHTGVVGHGGTAADPFIGGSERGFRDLFGSTSWMWVLREAGFRTVTVSPFGERHSAWHWYAGFSEIYNPGLGGMERADEVWPLALDWIQRNARTDNWFLHVNLWDPHTPYRTPLDFGNPFEEEPLPGWLTEEVRKKGWEGYGPHSPQEPFGFGGEAMRAEYPRVPDRLESMEAVKEWIDGYDVGIQYADEYVGRLLNALADAGVLDDTIVMVSSDHGENQGELNVWGDHQTADSITCRVPLVVSWPGITGSKRVDRALYSHYDWVATLIELLGAEVPENWDAGSFTDGFRGGKEEGRPFLVTSQNAWSCQRGVVFEDFIYLRTYHDGYKMLEPSMLFHLRNDPHEQKNLIEEEPETVNKAKSFLEEWYTEMARTGLSSVDPMMTVLREGGPHHTRGRLPGYLEHLRATGRSHHAEKLLKLHPYE